MEKSKIEWTDYSLNIIKGYCPNTCSYCYSHRMYNRFKWDKTIRFDVDELKKLKSIKQPSKIFVGSMVDMYHPTIDPNWVDDIIKESNKYPQHIFITLSKFHDEIYSHEFPSNWWVGVTIDRLDDDITYYSLIGQAFGVKNFISFEPLLMDMKVVSLMNMDWVIIGGLSPKNIHKTEWIDDIVSSADKLNIPVYIKENANYKERRKFFPNFKV